jgi:hypothetical protein
METNRTKKKKSFRRLEDIPEVNESPKIGMRKKSGSPAPVAMPSVAANKVAANKVAANKVEAGPSVARIKINRTKRSSPKRSSPKRSSPKRKSTSSPKRKSTSSPKRKSTSSSQKRRKAASVITRFFKKTKHTRKALFLQSLCSDSGFCLAIGNYAQDIEKHFAGFTSFDYVKAPIKRIGAASMNGFINQIEYQHRGYKAYAILKSAKTPEADNLAYEYIVGQFINQLNTQYPCFLETYGYYLYNDDVYWNRMQQDAPNNDISILKNGLSLITTSKENRVDYGQACKSSQKLAILIQHLNNIQALDDLSRNPDFNENELMNALFQLYIPLAKLKDNFTHYDLHLNNIYMYEPVVGKYIEYHYYLNGVNAAPISFKSRYMLKIIDYGRSYFNDEYKGVNAKDVYEKEICAEADCNTPVSGKCGSDVGFSWLTKLGPRPKKDFYISAQQRNMSHDLLPLTRLKENNDAPHVNMLTPELNALVDKVLYTDYYGTKEKTTKGYPRRINNVNDAALALIAYVSSAALKRKNEEVYAGQDKLGDLHVYMGGVSMEFVPLGDLIV